MAWRTYVDGSSAAPRLARVSVETEDIADFARPPGELEAVRLEERQGDALEAEADARAVRHFAVRGADVERHAEVVEVVVARADGGRLLRRADRDHEFVLEVLLA